MPGSCGEGTNTGDEGAETFQGRLALAHFAQKENILQSTHFYPPLAIIFQAMKMMNGDSKTKAPSAQTNPNQ
jgi:hypothetical protein